MRSEWIVVVEAKPPAGGPGVSLAAVRRLMERLADMQPTTLYSPDTYALQLTVTASSAAEALFIAVSTWRAAETALDLTPWTLGRAEVITPEEFERERKTSASRAEESLHHAQTSPAAVEERLLRQAFHDPLTGLPNRELFLDHLDRALRRMERAATSHALLLCDLDSFQEVNERLGEDGGDEVLLAVADRLVAALRPGDSVARIGGDRFAVLLEDTSAAAAEVVTRRLLAAISRPTRVRDRQIVVRGSIGIALSEPGQDLDALMGRAVFGLSKAKENGTGQYSFFDCSHRPRDLARVERSFPTRPDKFSYFRLLEGAAIAASEETSLEDAAGVILRQVCAHTGWPVGHLYVVSGKDPDRLESSNAWCTAAPQRFVPFIEETMATAPARGVDLAGAVLAAGAPAWIGDLSSDSTFPRAETASRVGLCAGFAFPVVVGEEVVGVLEFFSDHHMDPERSLWEVMTGVGAYLGRVVERERAAAALRRSEEQFRALVQHSSDMVSVLAADGTLRLHFGPRVLGYGEGEKVGERVWQLVHPDDLERAASAMAEFLSRPGPCRRPFEVRLRHADGTWRWIEVVGNNLLDNPDVGGLVLNTGTIYQ
jgi:diguanylate cyclase (GGDEF)-like protein/PAS domain S-box-containing protein